MSETIEPARNGVSGMELFQVGQIWLRERTTECGHVEWFTCEITSVDSVGTLSYGTLWKTNTAGFAPDLRREVARSYPHHELSYTLYGWEITSGERVFDWCQRM